jgi:hypothetical protein
MMIAAVIVSTIIAFAQSPPTEDSPTAVVERLFKMGDDGALLTSDGCERAGAYSSIQSRVRDDSPSKSFRTIIR